MYSPYNGFRPGEKGNYGEEANDVTTHFDHDQFIILTDTLSEIEAHSEAEIQVVTELRKQMKEEQAAMIKQRRIVILKKEQKERKEKIKKVADEGGYEAVVELMAQLRAKRESDKQALITAGSTRPDPEDPEFIALKKEYMQKLMDMPEVPEYNKYDNIKLD